MVRLSRLSTLLLKNPLGYKAWADNLCSEIEQAVADIEANVAAIAEAAKKAYVINPIPDVVIEADSAGTIKAGELTRNVNITASDGTADITTLVTWSRTVTSGITCTIGASTGILAITAMTAQEVDIPIQFTYSGITRVGTVHVVKQNDVTEAAKLSVVMDPISDVIIYADSAGVVKTGELPREVGVTASNGLTNLTSSVTWARTATTGVTCTIGASTGILSITDLSVAEVNIPVSFTYGTITREGKVHVVRQDDPPTVASGGSGGGAGTKATTTTLANATATTYGTAESATLTVEAGAAGKVTCTAPIGFKRTPGTAAGVTGAYGKWQWRALAGSWADIATEVADTADAETIVNSGDPTQNTIGSISVTHTKTGLTAGTQYEFKFLWRKVDVSGDVDSIYRSGGTLTADGTVA